MLAPNLLAASHRELVELLVLAGDARADLPDLRRLSLLGGHLPAGISHSPASRTPLSSVMSAAFSCWPPAGAATAMPGRTPTPAMIAMSSIAARWVRVPSRRWADLSGAMSVVPPRSGPERVWTGQPYPAGCPSAHWYGLIARSVHRRATRISG